AFTAHDATMSSMSLMAYSFGLLGFILVKILAPAFYSRKDMKTPVKVAVVALVTNIILNLILIGPFAHVGLAAATTISAFVNSGLLYWYLTKQGVFKPLYGWTKLFMQTLIANAVLIAFLLLVSPAIESWYAFDVWLRMAWLFGLVIGAILLYGLVLILVGLNPKRLVNKS
ncbi:MAG: lipid II flippase MurJ, partial [Thiomicrorhabdus sp.]|nr:lipid II flippase MurJ [Thiomicrorhabdus sp.]